MERSSQIYQAYVNRLKDELMLAAGCTEPISVAYCSAKARELLGTIPDYCLIEASGNIIKNVKSVLIPNTNGLKGLESAAAAGIIAGAAEKELKVLSCVTEAQKQEIKAYRDSIPFDVRPLNLGQKLDIIITLKKDGHYAKVRIAGHHTNIVHAEKDGDVLVDVPVSSEESDKSSFVDTPLNVADILEFANTLLLEDVTDILDQQIMYNTAISQEGLKNSWGANIGRVILATEGKSIRVRAKAAAAAGSDARMSGCECPVVICAGSGNQGITASVPVIEYAREYHATQEQLYRALVVSNLITLHIRDGMGALSAYCGAVCAGCGAGCGIAYLAGGQYDEIAHTITNTLAITSGIVCDGAKPSCAGKIAVSVEAGILGHEMYKAGQQFYGGDGILAKGVEASIRNVARLGSVGMEQADKEILGIMTGS